MNDPGLQQKLKVALENPAGSEAQKLLTQLLPVLCACHAAVRFSTSERYSVLGKMRVMVDFFGMPNVFFSSCPQLRGQQAHSNPFCLQEPSRGELLDTFQRFASLAQNPAAASRIYERQLRAFQENLLGLPSAVVTKKG